MKKLLFIINKPSIFISHRLAIAITAREKGYDVQIAGQDDEDVPNIEALGFTYHRLPLSRSGSNPFAELWALLSIWLLLWRVKPDVLHLVTLKPALYGGIAARFAPVKGVVAALAGLGYVFMSNGHKVRVVRKVVVQLLKFSFSKKSLLVIFQNPDDKNLMVRLGVISEAKTRLIRGSGVSLSEYPFTPEPAHETVVVTFASRLLFDKGIQEYVDAAAILKARGVNASFQIIGNLDLDNPTNVTSEQLSEWGDISNIEVGGYRKDIASVFAASNLVVLPSYREGLPKVLIEAAACGRAVVTTDVPGCRDAITQDVTGLLVHVKDAESLANAMEKLILDSELRQQMGKAGRALAEEVFAVEKVVQQHLDIYHTVQQ